jgi:hypothetical protein
VIGGVLLVTIAMNLLSLSHSALIAPTGRLGFTVSPALIATMVRRRNRSVHTCAGCDWPAAIRLRAGET